MDRIFILGTTKYSFMLHSMIEEEGQYQIIGHTVSRKYLENNYRICNDNEAKLYPLEHLKKYVNVNEKVKVLNTIGYTEMNQVRQRLFDECEKLGYESVNFVSSHALVFSNLIGKGNIILPGAYIGTNVNMGNNNVFYTGCVMTHDIEIGDNNFIAANVTVGGEVKIGNNCFVGMGAVLKNRITVKDFCLIGAATYLSQNLEREKVIVPPKSIVIEKKSIEMNLTPKQ